MIEFILNLNVHLSQLSNELGSLLYVLLFVIVFCETGLVVMPFLPGDSLLFAVGALASLHSADVNIWIAMVVMWIAAGLGDSLNYLIGAHFGKRVLNRPNRFIRADHVARTQKFFAEHGGKTIVLARFLPILRTFAPFVAGMGQMAYKQFTFYNWFGGFVWVFSLTMLGYGFGSIPSVQRNFHVVILAVILVSFLPVVFEIIRSQRSRFLQKP